MSSIECVLHSVGDKNMNQNNLCSQRLWEIVELDIFPEYLHTKVPLLQYYLTLMLWSKSHEREHRYVLCDAMGTAALESQLLHNENKLIHIKKKKKKGKEIIG